MTAKGHVILAATFTLAGAYIAKEQYPALIPPSSAQIAILSIGIFVGALLPDIDEENSYIGNKLKVISTLISSLVKHRTFTHYLIFPLLIMIAAFAFEIQSFEHYFILGVGFGVVFHDIGDMLTKGGIKGFFFPLFPNTPIALLPKFLRFKTFSIEEYLFIWIGLIPLNMYLLLKGVF